MPTNGKLKFDDLLFFVGFMVIITIAIAGVKIELVDKKCEGRDLERIAVQEELQTQIMQDIYAELTKWNS